MCRDVLVKEEEGEGETDRRNGITCRCVRRVLLMIGGFGWEVERKAGDALVGESWLG